MWDLEKNTEPKAAKDYPCDACEWIFNSINEGIFSFDEMRLIVKAKRDNWKVKKGQKYVKVTGIWNGDWSVFRGRPEIDALCHKYKIYQD